MKKEFLALTTIVLLGISSTSQAKQEICVFDLLGKAGESYKMMEEWALAAKTWNTDVQLIAYQNEELADKDFKNGKCDAAYITTMRARQYNKFAGSIDALGGVPTNAIALKAITFVLDKRNVKRLKTKIDNEEIEIGGIGQIGPAYIFVNDRAINTIEKGKGKKFAVLAYDKAQIAMVERVGAIPIPSDISNFIKKFNTGEVPMVGAPAYAFKPLEMEKGLGSKGALINFPVLNVTADLVFRSQKFPATFGNDSRTWFIKQLPRQFSMVKRLEEGIPAKYRLNLSKVDTEKYQKLLRDGRMDLTRQGIYDPTMMSVLKRARCTVDRTNFECSLAGE
ncbi:MULTISPECIES: putative solute-binding protein [Acinetobacter]|uniref:putative solute-binding protein n=1 Tax=Acinetobacter TaxID=469 RepID=UPI000D010FD6|nr:putative solute-binding protein [Acinetobacter sp. MYb10]QLD62277.1 RND transporter [Acinetobacter sp. MYb10]